MICTGKLKDKNGQPLKNRLRIIFVREINEVIMAGSRTGKNVDEKTA